MSLESKNAGGTPAAEEFKLQRYYYAVVATSLTAVLLIAFFINYFPIYFPWIRYKEVLVFSLIGLAAAQGIFFLLQTVFKKKIFFTIDRYSFIVFFFLGLYATGGVESAFTFILIFPLLVSAVDLDERATRQVGLIITVALALLIFADPIYWHDGAIIVKHVIRVFLYALIAFYLYRIVKETLRHKFEKEETKRKFSELIELDKVKSDFLTVAQHQLRTPLSGLRWGLENLLADTSIRPESRMILEGSRKKAENAMDIVNEMLRTVEMNTASFSPKKKSVELGALLSTVLEELKYLASRKGVTVSLSRGASLSIQADPKLLSAALLNILDNAIRFSPNGKVAVTLQSEDERAEISIADNGIGIHPDDLPYLFDRFYRGKNAILLEPNESGVGLYIAKQIIEKHRGTISVDSILGKGTTVRVSLP